jgi:small subunit ribosomal protein S19
MVNRSTVITPQMLGLTVQVYNGMSFFPVVIENDMIGHCLGEFAATRKKAKKKK